LATVRLIGVVTYRQEARDEEWRLDMKGT
jgi:hypothetical protein